MSHLQTLAQEFKLSKNEELKQGYNCLYKKKFFGFGILYLTKNYVWFDPSIRGKENQFKINLRRVKEIKKDNSFLPLQKSIIILTDDYGNFWIPL